MSAMSKDGGDRGLAHEIIRRVLELELPIRVNTGRDRSPDPWGVGGYEIVELTTVDAFEDYYAVVPDHARENLWRFVVEACRRRGGQVLGEVFDRG
jgi:hypothetical protein